MRTSPITKAQPERVCSQDIHADPISVRLSATAKRRSQYKTTLIVVRSTPQRLPTCRRVCTSVDLRPESQSNLIFLSIRLFLLFQTGQSCLCYFFLLSTTCNRISRTLHEYATYIIIWLMPQRSNSPLATLSGIDVYLNSRRFLTIQPTKQNDYRLLRLCTCLLA